MNDRGTKITGINYPSTIKIVISAANKQFDCLGEKEISELQEQKHFEIHAFKIFKGQK